MGLRSFIIKSILKIKKSPEMLVSIPEDEYSPRYHFFLLLKS